MWRRIHLIPFTVTIAKEKQDKKLLAKLKEELTGILAWCVQGCLKWQQQGLGMPEEVEAATAEYRSQQDVLAAFLTECCHQGSDYRSTASNLYGVYQCWCAENGEKDQATQREFGMALTERGFERYTDNGTKYRGIATRTEWLEKYEQRKERNQRNHFSG
jgi:putative DNA primase/helicase